MSEMPSTGCRFKTNYETIRCVVHSETFGEEHFASLCDLPVTELRRALDNEHQKPHCLIPGSSDEEPCLAYRTNEELRETVRRLEAQVKRMREALQEISEGKGRFSRDHFEHCRNTVEDMKALAVAALSGSPDA